MSGEQHRNKVDERTAIAVGVVSGVVCMMSGAEPTGTSAVDLALLFACGFAVAWAGASASWWVIGIAAAVSVAVSGSAGVALLGLVGFGLAVYVGVRRRNLPEARALSAAFVINALARSDLQVFLGLSAIVAIGIGAFIVLLGLNRRPSGVRASAEIVGTIIGVAGIAALVGFGVAAGSVRGPLQDGNKLAKDGLQKVNEGDFVAAQQLFEASGEAFARASDQLDKPWAKLSNGLPVVSQHYDAATELTDAASQATVSIVDALRDVDPNTVRIRNGRIDLQAVAALNDPFTTLGDAVDNLQQAIDTADSQWLVKPLENRMRDLEDDLAKSQVRLGNAQSAVELAPQILGAEGTRHYLVLFTTPAEARGLGGLSGNYAILEADDGSLEMTKFGRITDLNNSIENRAQLVGPEGYIERYRPYMVDRQGRVAPYAWSNLTMPPDFPTVAQVATELYPQSGGRPIDGVIVIDPYALAQLLTYTGPIEIDGYDTPLTSENAADLLLKEWYLVPNEDRVEYLDQAAEKTMDALLGGALPGPVELAKELGPLSSAGRLNMWTTDMDEQQLLHDTNVDGAFPTDEDGEVFGVTVDNLAGNKIDTYLQREVSYEEGVDPVTGVNTARAVVTLTNTAPASGLPDYVIGNIRDLPSGTNQFRLCIHTPLQLDQSDATGGDIPGFDAGRENGMNVYCTTGTLGPQKAMELTLDLSGDEEGDRGPAVIWEQPLVNDLIVTDDEGE